MLAHDKITDRIFHIKDEHNNRATLVVGTVKALLFDTMMGDEDLKGYVESLTDKELLVMNSHFHLDHVGGNAQFDKVYCNDVDWDIIEENYRNTFTIHDKSIDMTRCKESCAGAERLVDLKPGHVFDLGECHVEIIDLRGHTKGSVGAYIREERLLLVGDAISPQMCLFLGGQATIDDYRKTLQRVKELDIDGFLLSHFEGVYPKAVLDDFIECAKLETKKKGFRYEYSMIPGYYGKFYMYQPMNPLIHELVGIILPDEENN